MATMRLTRDAAEAVAYRLVAEKLVRLYEELQEERDNLALALGEAMAIEDSLGDDVRAALSVATVLCCQLDHRTGSTEWTADALPELDVLSGLSEKYGQDKDWEDPRSREATW